MHTAGDKVFWQGLTWKVKYVLGDKLKLQPCPTPRGYSNALDKTVLDSAVAEVPVETPKVLMTPEEKAVAKEKSISEREQAKDKEVLASKAAVEMSDFLLHNNATVSPACYHQVSLPGKVSGTWPEVERALDRHAISKDFLERRGLLHDDSAKAGKRKEGRHPAERAKFTITFSTKSMPPELKERLESECSVYVNVRESLKDKATIDGSAFWFFHVKRRIDLAGNSIVQ